MGNIQKWNISLLKSQKSDFDGEKDNFMNNAYNTFFSSYLKNCSDYHVTMMGNNLTTLYQEIRESYDKISNWWQEYNENIDGLDKFLTENGGSGLISKANIRNFIAPKIMLLEDYNKKNEINFTTISSNNTNFISSQTIDKFSSLYDGYSTIKDNLQNNAFNLIEKIKDNTKSFVSTTEIKASNMVEKATDSYNQTSEMLTEWWNNKAKPWLSNVADGIQNTLSSTGAKVTNTFNRIIEINMETEQANLEANMAQAEAIRTAANNVGDFFQATAEMNANIEQANLEANMAQAQMQSEVLKRTGSTIAVGAASIVEGIGNGIEAIIDGLASLGSLTVRAQNWQNYVDGYLTYEQYEQYTDECNDMVQEFVTKEYVTDWTNDKYENTTLGQELKENSYAFDTVRSIGNGVGYTTAIAATSAIPGVGTIGMATVAGIAGVGNGTEESWNNGASINEGLTYGLANGVWEGVQYFIGGKIGAPNGFGTRIGTKIAGEAATSAQQQAAISLSRIILDGLDGGVEGFVQPALQSIYKDGTYNELFQDNGGWKYVATNTIVGSATSAIGEVTDISKYLFKESDVTTDSINVKDIDIDSNAVKNNINSDKINSRKLFDNDSLTDATAIANANFYTNKGNMVTFKFNDASGLPDISDNFWKNILNSDKVFINVNGRIMSFDDAISYKMNYDLNLKSTIGDSNLLQDDPAKSINADIDDTVELSDLNVNKKLREAMKILDDFGNQNDVDKYGKKALENYARTGSVMQNNNGIMRSYITNKGGVRDFIASLNPKTVAEYLDFDENMKKAINTLDEFGGSGYGLKALENYVKTGSVMQNNNGVMKSYITSKDGVRDFIASLNPTIVGDYLGITTNISSNYFELDSIGLKTYELLKNSDFIFNNFSEKNIISALTENFHTYASETEFLNAYGHEVDGVIEGFSRGDEIHINPKFDAPHVRVHEGLHKITSEFDSNGKRIATGFENFRSVDYDDYLNGDKIFNEGATEYLTHKIVGDGCQSGTYRTSFEFWKGLDELLNIKYGNNDIIFEAYKNHDATPIRKFMDYYGGNGTFDKVKIMAFVNDSKATQVLDEIRLGISKELNPSFTGKIADKLRNIFGG